MPQKGPKASVCSRTQISLQLLRACAPLHIRNMHHNAARLKSPAPAPTKVTTSNSMFALLSEFVAMCGGHEPTTTCAVCTQPPKEARGRHPLQPAVRGARAHAATLPQRVAAVQNQVMPSHVGSRIRCQQHDRRLQVGDFRQAPCWDLRQPLLAERSKRIRLLRHGGAQVMLCTHDAVASLAS